MRGTPYHKALSIVLALCLLLDFLPSSIGATPPPPPPKGTELQLDDHAQSVSSIAPEILHRIEPALLKEMVEAGEVARFVVYLREEADLAAAAGGRATASERRRGVITSGCHAPEP